MKRSASRSSGNRRLLIGAGLAAVALVLGSPLLMAQISDSALPWDRLANVGDAYGGASALLSAAALCGIGASLIFQQRQLRQELTNIDRQQHMDLIKIAIENPELIEVLDARTAASPHARERLYANLTMMYWLAVWQLGEVDDSELRAMADTMFRSAVTREWWAEVGHRWIGTDDRPDRIRFVSMISQAMRTAEAGDVPPRRVPAVQRVGGGRDLAAVGAVTAALAVWVLLRRRRSGRTDPA